MRRHVRSALGRFVNENARRLDARVEHAVNLVFELLLHAGQDRGEDPSRDEPVGLTRCGQRQTVHVGLLVHGEGVMEEERLVDFKRNFPQAFLNGEAERRQWQTGVPVVAQLPTHLSGALPIKEGEMALSALRELATGLGVAHMFPSSEFLRREAGI